MGICRSWEGLSSSNFHSPAHQRVFSDGGMWKTKKPRALIKGAGVHGLRAFMMNIFLKCVFFRSLTLSQFSYHNLQLPDFWCFWCNDRLMSSTFAVPKWWEMVAALFRNQLADALNGVDEVGIVGNNRCLKTENPLPKWIFESRYLEVDLKKNMVELTKIFRLSPR